MWKATGPIFMLSKYRISRIERYTRTMSITGKTQKMVVRDITQLFAKHTFEHTQLPCYVKIWYSHISHLCNKNEAVRNIPQVL